MNLGSWLRSLGLERYEAAFRDNAIDEAVLRDLREDHLRELGLPLGARIKLLKAIAALQQETDDELLADVAGGNPSTDAAERRQVTVMFSDLVGSTALSARMDPEDLRKLISAYQKCVTETIHAFDGFVAKYMGDGVLIYFGYPQAHEDDAERAVRAALEFVAKVTGLQTSVSLQTRVGIATGLVVVGDLIGSGEAQERGIVGETPNLAARLQGLAEPDMVVVADSTRRLLGNLFELQDRGHQELKGIAGAVHVWAALRPAAVESRFDAFHGEDLASFVGREEESELLLRRWSKSKGGEGQVVLLSGEAGIGKSRLTAALLEQIGEEPHARLRCFCSPQHTVSALYPIIGQLERGAELAHDDSLRAKLDKLDSLLARSETSPDDSALLAELLSLQNDGRYPALTLEPQQRRQRTLEALLTQVVALARSQPVLMIFEDAHWTDPTSLELFGSILQRIATLRVLLIITFRPEFQPPWIGLSHVTAVTINRLGRLQIDAIIDRIVGNKYLPPNIREDVIDRSDGIPLFVEEITKAVLEADSEDEARRTAAAIPSPKLAIPATLHASLMARLDRLGSAKEVAQIGAAIGREFSHALIEAVTRKSQVELETALHRLIAAGLLFRQGVAPHATYLFKHALVQDAAYGTLLREQRRSLHADVAEVLETRFADAVERQPEVLARHYTEAGQIENAARFWGRAGYRSLERSAVVEASEQLARALCQTASLPSTPTLRPERIKLQVAAANALMHVKGYAAPETRTSLNQARSLIEEVEALGEPLDDPLLLFSVLYGLWVASYNAFDGDAVRQRAAECLAAAEKQPKIALLMIGRRLVGISLAHTGNLADGRANLDYARQLYNPVEHRPLATRFGQDIGVGILYQRALPLWMLGYPDAALADCDQATKDAREIGLTTTLMPALLYTTIIHILCGNDATANRQANELVILAEENRSALWKAFGVLLQGVLLAQTAKPSEAGRTITTGIGALRATGSTLWMPFWSSYLAKSYMGLGQTDEAWRCVDEATTTIKTSEERLFEPEVSRLAGEIALLSAEPDIRKAEAYFARSLAVAREQQAKSWELRAATSMARLRRDQGEPDKARELLSPIYSWFTEGLLTRDLREAKALLLELQ
jgi:class 3 adenylate cyclase/predicted ATPase/tRNA A37 threonylcarbamoyladenosine biosynthesis protein TsaE